VLPQNLRFSRDGPVVGKVLHKHALTIIA